MVVVYRFWYLLAPLYDFHLHYLYYVLWESKKSLESMNVWKRGDVGKRTWSVVLEGLYQYRHSPL